MSKEAERAESVGDADHDNALLRQLLAAVGWDGRTTDAEAAAVDPYQNGDMGRCGLCRCPDVEVEAVLAGGYSRNALKALGRELVGVPNAVPMRGWLRSFPTEIANWRSSERNASINCEPIFDCSLQQALFNLCLWDCG
jgi:hypothetical protein